MSREIASTPRVIFKGVAPRVASATIVFSSVIALIITSHQLYQRYVYDLGVIDSRFKQIEDVNLGTLSNSMWLADKKDLQVSLEGMLKIPDIQYLEVSDKSVIWASAGTYREDAVKTTIMPMTYRYKGKVLVIGVLKVVANLDSVYRNVYEGIWTVLISNGIKTFMVALFILYIFHRLVFRHLRRIANAMNVYDIEIPDHKIQLDRKRVRGDVKDELDLLVDSFNEMHHRLRESFATIEEQVEARTKEVRDIQDELLRKERLATLGQLTATVSHELRNPLASMMSSVFILKKVTNAEDDKSQQALFRLERSINRCDRIVDELLGYTRMDKLTFVDTDIDVWLATILEEQQIPAAIRVATDFQLAGRLFQVDPELLRRAVINIVDNACHAMQDEGNNHQIIDNAILTVKTGVQDGRLKIQVQDTGCGMSQEVIGKVFEPLFSVKGFGIGLGMPTVKKIITQHDGGIDIDSTPGKGTTVTLWLPVTTKLTVQAVANDQFV